MAKAKSIHPRVAKAKRLGVYHAQKPGAVVSSDEHRKPILPKAKKSPKSPAKTTDEPTINELRAKAKELGISAGGSKDALTDRIADAEEDLAVAEAEVVEDDKPAEK